MPATDFIKIIPLQQTEPNLTWEMFCQSPYKLLQAFTQYFAVEGKFLENLPAIIFSATTPGAPDRSKIWIKTSNPYAIGLFLDGQYRMDYGPSQLQVNIPFLADPNTVDATIQGLGQMSDDDVTSFGIPQTVTTATSRWRWYIFKPGDIEV